MFKKFLSDEQGGLVEYLILLCAMALCSVLIFPSLRTNLVFWNNDSVHNIDTAISGKPSDGDAQWSDKDNSSNNNNGSGSVVTPEQKTEYKVVLEEPTYFNNHQIRVALSPSNFDYSKAKADGSDISFIDENKKQLKRYIEKWNPKGESVIWVKVDEMLTGELTLLSGDNRQNSNNPKEVFDFYEDFNKPLDPTVWLIPDIYKDNITIKDGKLRMTDSLIEFKNNIDLNGKAIWVKQSVISTDDTSTWFNGGIILNTQQLSASSNWDVRSNTVGYINIQNEKVLRLSQCVTGPTQDNCGGPAARPSYSSGEFVDYELYYNPFGSYYKVTGSFESYWINSSATSPYDTFKFWMKAPAKYLQIGFKANSSRPHTGTVEYDQFVIRTGNDIKNTVKKITK
ncbi:DUF2341 domain-containing protein [Bacillus toyonensis]|uniref:DUF2341 domain-containing protein n=1 Tax=Bacillus toyonensis TaxID=155322 RepID=UPI002E21DA1D|nr:DUF2341 domain-containing protein [Bacillus toyonensis]